MIEVSIIIPVLNQKESLLAALESLRKQIDNARFYEIVICDDGSTDGTDAAIKKLRYPIFFKYLRNPSPLGRAANRNRGAEKSSGRVLIFIDGDMVPDEKYVESILLGIDSQTVKLGEVLPPPEYGIDRFEKYLYTRGRHAPGFGNANIHGRMFTSNNFAIEKSLFEKVSGFDPAFQNWGGEDIDFGLKLTAQGARLIYDRKAITFHYHRRDLVSTCRQFREFGKGTLNYLLEKHPHFAEDLPFDILNRKKKSALSHLVWGLLLKAMTSSFVLDVSLMKVKILSWFPWPDFIYDFLLWGNLIRGYSNRPKNIERK